jgi:acetyl esterase/lipase
MMFVRHTGCGATVLIAFLGGFVSEAAAAKPAFDAHRDQVYVERDSGPLGLDLYVPHGDGPFPAVIVVHGGAWASGTRAQLSGFAQAMANMGYVAATISYRLAPQHPFPAQVHDCQAAVRWLRSHADEFKIDSEHIGGFGYSAGGHLVAMLGAMDDGDLHEDGLPEDAPSARIQVVVAGGAPCDFRMLADDSQRLAYWLGGTPGEKPDAYREASPTTYVTKDDAPMFFYHGTDDTVVPIHSPQRMVELLKETGVPVEFFAVPKAGHALAVRDPEAIRLAMAFAERYLKPVSTGVEDDDPAREETEAVTADAQ